MNSPGSVLWQKMITLDKTSKTPIYVQIAQQIINAIQQNRLADGIFLPGSRIFSKHLNIHRNTATAVYNELAAQGWATIIPNKGTFIINRTKQKQAAFNMVNVYPLKTNFTFYESSNLASPYEKLETTYTFNDGQTDIRIHNSKDYNRWYNAALQKTTLMNKWNTYIFDRSSYLQSQLCNYVNTTRNLKTKPNNILVTNSTETSLYITTQLLIKPNDTVLVAELSNFSANMIFSQAKAKIVTIPLDEHGIDVDYIEATFKRNEIRLVYCNTNRHYPTTNTLSKQRRNKLLQLANQLNFAIIEDDFDFDFEYGTNDLKPLISEDQHGSIIYLGKIGQALFPAFETAFIIAPENLISEAKNYYKMIDNQGDLIKEQILAELIAEGELHRQLKKKVVVYQQRRDTMVNALHKNFGILIDIQNSTGGLALFVNFKTPISLLKLSTKLKKYNVTLPKYLLYQTKNICGIRLGYGHLDTDEINFTIKMLRKAYDDLLN